MSQLSGNYPDLVPHFGHNPEQFEDRKSHIDSAPAPVDPLSAPFGSSAISLPVTEAKASTPYPAATPVSPTTAVPSPPTEKETIVPIQVVKDVPIQTAVPQVAREEKQVRDILYKEYAHTEECIFHPHIEDFAESLSLFADAYGLGKKTGEKGRAKVPYGFEKQSSGLISPWGFSLLPSTSYVLNMNSGNTKVTNNNSVGTRSKQAKEEQKDREAWRRNIGIAAAIGIPIVAYLSGRQVSVLVYLSAVGKNRKAAEQIVRQSMLSPHSAGNPHLRLVQRALDDWRDGAKAVRRHELISLSGKVSFLFGACAALTGYLASNNSASRIGALTALASLSVVLFESSRFSFLSKPSAEKKIARAAQAAEEILSTKEAHVNPKHSTNPQYY